jgi:acetylxylan esterase
MVRLSSFAALASAASLAAAAPVAPRQTCYSGFYMIVARGSDEAPGEGAPGAVADLIAASVPDSASVAVDYPATIVSTSGIEYPESVIDGINDTIDKIQSYVDACGSASRIVLLGYSQGGNVMTDALAGGVFKPDPIGPDLSPYSKSLREGCVPSGG